MTWKSLWQDLKNIILNLLAQKTTNSEMDYHIFPQNLFTLRGSILISHCYFKFFWEDFFSFIKSSFLLSHQINLVRHILGHTMTSFVDHTLRFLLPTFQISNGRFTTLGFNSIIIYSLTGNVLWESQGCHWASCWHRGIKD